MGGYAKRGDEGDLILRSGACAASRRMGHTGASWFETAQARLLTMRDEHST